MANDLENEWGKRWEIVTRHLNNQNVIISAEDIYKCEIDKFLVQVKEKFGNIKVLVYLRRQDRVTESRYNQRVKGNLTYKTFEEFVESEAEAENFLEYALKLDSISRIIGRENLIVRIYEKQQLIGNDTVTDFLSVIGIPSNQDDWERVQTSNHSLAGNYLEINRLLNSVLSVDSLMGDADSLQAWTNWKVKTDFRNVCTELSCSFNRDKGEGGLFTPDQRKEFLKKFALCNEYVAREYLHRESGILFYEDLIDYPMVVTDRHNNFEEDIIRVFAAMMYVQAYRFKNLLEKSMMNIAGRLLMKEAHRKCKNRKILLFGAGHNCQRLFDMVGGMEVSIVDSDLAKRDMVLGGVPVRHSQDITEWREYFIIVTCEETYEIEDQLSGFGLNKEEDYILMKEYTL